MKYLITVIACFLLSFSTEWKSVKINESIEVSMPGVPVDEVKNGFTFKKLVLADSTKFTSGAIDLTRMGVTEAQIQQLAPSEQYKAQFKQGLEMSGKKIVAEEYTQYNGNYCYQYVLEKEENGKKVTTDMRCIFFKNFLIQLSYTHGSKGRDAESLNRFFNSLKL